MIPESFLERMKKLLGEEYPAFLSSLSEPNVRGVRVNTLKAEPKALTESEDFKLSPLPFCPCGFILENEVQVGQTPEHHSGMIYMQDPGAMASAAAVEVTPDMKVIDLCAAPGGKTGQIAAGLTGNGYILANEYVPARAKILVSNLERLGVKNSIVTSLDTGELAKLFDGEFDLAVCDAPCSGEGMFRKYTEASEEWSEENVALCAKRQAEILDNAARLVAPGGRLLYSTCTFSPEENELCVAAFLERHPSFKLIPLKQELSSCGSEGIAFEGVPEKIKLTRRFYPHKFKGEGQYVALMQNTDLTPKKKTILYKDSAKPLDKQQSGIVNEFFKAALCEVPKGRLCNLGERVILIPEGVSIPPRSVFMAGVLVGEIRGRLLFPSHQFFSCYGELFRLKEELSCDTGRLFAYLSGEEIASSLSGSGYLAVTYKGASLGGGKLSSGRIKNHYPKGLRNKF